MALTGKERPAAVDRVGGIRSKDEQHQVIHTLGHAFADHWAEHHVDRALFRGPVFRPEHARVVVAKGQVVAAAIMGPRMMRFGSVKVPAMTLGPIGTHDRHRKRGYAAAAMKDAARYMAENGRLVAYLLGIPDFYYRFGYYPFMAPGRVKVKRKSAEKEARPGRLRAMKRDHLPAVRRLYDSATARRTCSAARDKAVWDWLVGPGTRTWLFRKPRVILDARDRLCGYVTLRGSHDASHGEIVVRPDERSCRVALGALVREARRHERSEIGLPLPWDDPFARFLRRFVEAEWILWTNPTGGPLLKVIDFPALMRRLQPLFELRLRQAGRGLTDASFTLATDIGEVGLVVTRKGVRVQDALGGPRVTVPERWLSGLLTGYYSVADAAARRGAPIPAGVRAHMEALFPTGWPFVYQGDNY